MMSITDMLDAAADAIAECKKELAVAWLTEVEAHAQFTTGRERRQYFCLLQQLQPVLV